jgi:hypothetical protein
MMLGWVAPTSYDYDYDGGCLGVAVSVDEAEIEKAERNLSTSEKILIVSLFLNVAALAWSVYQFRETAR